MEIEMVTSAKKLWPDIEKYVTLEKEKDVLNKYKHILITDQVNTEEEALMYCTLLEEI